MSHYEILERLGTGGMGVVYKARDTTLNRLVALKFLPGRLTGDEEATRRFVEEARTASALDHAHICTIHEISQTADGLLFMVMSYVQGETLKERIGRGPLPVEDALDIAVQITEGLMEAHEHGIAHRDVKPGNVLITSEDRVKIVDFGLASLVGLPPENKPGLFMGTLLYMSPEQLRNEPVDHRSDLWSLGVTMYEMLAGRAPFGTSDDQPIVHAVLYEEPRPWPSCAPTCRSSSPRSSIAACARTAPNATGSPSISTATWSAAAAAWSAPRPPRSASSRPPPTNRSPRLAAASPPSSAAPSPAADRGQVLYYVG